MLDKRFSTEKIWSVKCNGLTVVVRSSNPRIEVRLVNVQNAVLLIQHISVEQAKTIINMLRFSASFLKDWAQKLDQAQGSVNLNQSIGDVSLSAICDKDVQKSYFDVQLASHFAFRGTFDMIDDLVWAFSVAIGWTTTKRKLIALGGEKRREEDSNTQSTSTSNRTKRGKV